MQSKRKTKRISAAAVTGACLAGGYTLAFSSASQAALLSGVVFNDALATNGSTFDVAGQSFPNTATPTATSTNYNVGSSKDSTTFNGGSSLTSGGPLKITMVSTSSGIAEAQAVFGTTPVHLVNIGDAIELTVTFTDVAGIANASSSTAAMGLYSSSASAPYNNLGNGSSASPTITGFNNTQINDNTGGTQGWLGYETINFGGQTTKLFNRGTQAISANNTDQELIAPGQTGGYATSTQATYTSQSAATPLTAGNTYTDELEITLTAANVYTLNQQLYNGSSDTGTLVGTATVGTIAALPSGGFDALAIGFRQTQSVGSEMDVSQIEVSTNTVPEPASVTILSLAGLTLLSRRRRS